MTREEIILKTSLYVHTRAYDRALDVLKSHNSCVISGIPGIGKTTLAQVLVTKLMEDGYELIAVRSDIREAFELLDPRKLQVVYYDDFLGQSSIEERLSKNEDRGIMRLLDEATRSSNIKIVMTTREYLLEDAKRVYEPLNDGRLDVAKCIIGLADYTIGARSRILYNHVYFSRLGRSYAIALSNNQGYKKIVGHHGYNPRIIEWMTLRGGATGVAPGQYLAEFIGVLSNPKRVWDHAFLNQLDDSSHSVLYCVGAIDGWFGLDDLRKAWKSVQVPSDSSDVTLREKREFEASLRKLDGSFVRTFRLHRETTVQFHNPSIKDFISFRIAEDEGLRVALLTRAIYFEQVVRLACIDDAGKLSREFYGPLLNHDVLFDAIRRTLFAPVPRFEIIHYSADISQRFVRPGVDAGSRVSRLVDALKCSVLARSTVFLCDLAKEAFESGEAARIATVGSVHFLEFILQNGIAREKYSPLVAKFTEQIEENLFESPTIDDWNVWSTFIASNAVYFSAEQFRTWKTQAKSFCRDEFEDIRHNVETVGQAEEYFDAITTITDRLKLDFSPEKAEFELFLQDLQQDDEVDQKSAAQTARRLEQEAEEDSDDAIENLFASLGDSDIFCAD